MGARPAEFEPTNLKTPSLCACGRIAPAHWLRTAWDLNSLVLYLCTQGIMCTETHAL